MFIGHFAVGFAAKRWAPDAPLGALLLAPLLLDVLWPVFCLIGIERFRIPPDGDPFLRFEFVSYPWSHSLLMALVWGALLALLWRARGGASKTAVVLFIGVVSHWVLDFIVHLPDLPVWPFGPTVGLGLWSQPAFTIIVELAMLAAGAWLYVGTTKARDRIGALGAPAYLLVLVAFYVLSFAGPPPPVGAERLVAIMALIGVLLVPLASWVDGHRREVGG